MLFSWDDINPTKKVAQTTGLLYLISIILAFFPGFVYSTLIVPGDVIETAQKIMANEGLLRIGFMSDLIHQTLYIIVAWFLYLMLKPNGKNLALLFMFLVSIGVAIQCLNLLLNFTSLYVFMVTDYKAVFESDQLQAQVMLFRNLYENGILVAQIFFGLWLFPLGYLVKKSRHFPNVLGILLIIGSFGLVLESFQYFLLPGYEVITYPGLIVSGLAEISFCLWLLIIGVKVDDPAAIASL